MNRAKRTLNDLEAAPEATIRHYGNTYIHPYTAAEYPDIMVQMATIASLHDYGAWLERKIPFLNELSKGLGKIPRCSARDDASLPPQCWQGQGRERGR